MTITDIIALAKQGYKPSDIKELLEISEKLPAEPQPTENEPQEPDEREQTPAENNSVETVEEPEKDSVDYKSLYEATQKTVETLQNANINQNIQKDKLDDSAVFNDIVKSFM